MKTSAYLHRLQSVRPVRQKGIALVIALILLVIMTLIGLSAMRTVSLEERMTGQTFDRSISFQAAEAALKEGEALLVGATPPTPTSGCSLGVCAPPAVSSTERWLDASFTDWQNATTLNNGGISITPQYIVEYLGNTFPCNPGSPTSTNDCKRYRVTARSNAGADRAAVILQTMYATD